MDGTIKATILASDMETELRKSKGHQFIKSREFGLTTWASMYMMRRSVHTMLNAIRAESGYIKRLETISDGDLPSNALEREELRNFLQLDVISKLMMLIETTFALSDALSAKGSEVPRKLAYYGLGVIERFQRLLQDPSSNSRIMLARILALPSPSKFSIGTTEREAMQWLTDGTCKNFSARLMAWASFYRNHSIAYNKLKHGLSLTTGYHVRDETGVDAKQFSLSFAYDRVGERKRPLPTNIVYMSGQIHEGAWFDTINIIPFSEENLNLYVNLATEIDNWIGYIVDNQLTRAENADETYLPGRYAPDKKAYTVIYMCNQNESGRDLGSLRDFFQNIIKEMYINPDRTSLIEFFFSNDKAAPKLLSIFKAWNSATISFSPAHESAPAVKSEIRLLSTSR